MILSKAVRMPLRLLTVAILTLLVFPPAGAWAKSKEEKQAEAGRSLLYATIKGDLSKVKALLESGADVNFRLADAYSLPQNMTVLLNSNTPGVHGFMPNKQAGMLAIVDSPLGGLQLVPLSAIHWKTPLPFKVGLTALIGASQAGHLDVVQALLAKGAKVNDSDDFGQTALIKASEGGHLEIVQELIAKGADVNAMAGDGTTALSTAMGARHLDVVATLRAKGAEDNPKARSGAAVPVAVHVNAGGRGSVTTLLVASKTGNLPVVQAQLDQGVDVNARAESGATALLVASQAHHLDVVQALLAKGASVNGMDEDGSSPLLEAARWGNLDLVNALLAKGADVNARGEIGSALECAAEDGYLEVVQALLSHGANVNIKDPVGDTALMKTVRRGQTEVVLALLAKGADVNAKRKEGGTALMDASMRGYSDVVRALLSHGAEVNAKAVHCDTPYDHCTTALQAATQNRHLDVVTLLIQAGAKQ